MVFINAILYALNWVKDLFYDAYLTVSGWIWPFNLLATPLYWLYGAFYSLVLYVKDFGDWVDDVWAKVLQIFSLEQITAYFKWLIDIALAAWDWVTNSFWNVWNIVEDWWSSAKFTVLGWIDIATEGFNALIVWWDEFWKITWPQWMATLEVLGSDVSYFFTHTLPTLFDIRYAEEWWRGKLPDIGALIHSTLLEWLPFYDDLVNIWNDVVEFFCNPLEFLLNRFFDWFLGPEE